MHLLSGLPESQSSQPLDIESVTPIIEVFETYHDSEIQVKSLGPLDKQVRMAFGISSRGNSEKHPLLPTSPLRRDNPKNVAVNLSSGKTNTAVSTKTLHELFQETLDIFSVAPLQKLQDICRFFIT